MPIHRIKVNRAITEVMEIPVSQELLDQCEEENSQAEYWNYIDDMIENRESVFTIEVLEDLVLDWDVDSP